MKPNSRKMIISHGVLASVKLICCDIFYFQVIKIPIKKSSDNTEGYRTFLFGCSTIQGDPKGSFDCIKQQVSHG